MPDVPVSQIEYAAPREREGAYFQAVAEGRADIAAGRVLTPQSIDDWVETVGTTDERPPSAIGSGLMPGPTTAREVRIGDRAARDLARIWQWWRMAGSEEHARLTLKTISRAIKNLPFTPLGSPMRPDTGARERAVDRHMIVYDVEAGEGPGPSAGHVNVLGIVGLFLDEDPETLFEV